MDELTGMFTMGSRHVLLNTKRLGNSLMGSRGREEGKGKREGGPQESRLEGTPVYNGMYCVTN